jgi:hypothetical protein
MRATAYISPLKGLLIYALKSLLPSGRLSFGRRLKLCKGQAAKMEL